jgi:hypothetical protein
MKMASVLLIAICASVELFGAQCVEVSQREAFRHVFAVFRGTAVRVRVMHPGGSEPTLVTFKVDRAWKGPVTETMRVLVFGRPPEGDTYPFHEGIRYVVYATNDVPEDFENLRYLSGGSPVYGVGPMCVWRVRTDVERESKRLGRGQPPKPDPATP